MNKTATTQPAKTTSFLPSNRGILQRKCTCGNHTIAGSECADCAKKKIGLQRKLTIGASNDPLEQEADRIADQVMASPGHGSVSDAPIRIQRFTGNPSGQGMEVPASVERVLASPGQPLETGLRQEMEGRFGYDFSRVRVHAGGIAEQSAKEVSANAYTVGNNIVFGAGQYDPGAHKGKKLITHELTHVLQQGLSTDAFQSNSEHLENSGMGRNGNVMPVHSNVLATSVLDTRPVLSQLIPATKQLVLQRQETAESSSRDSQFSELLATTRDLGAIARGEGPRPSSRSRRPRQHHGGQSGIDTFARVARRFPNIDQQIRQYATHFYGMHRRIEMVTGGSVQFHLSQTYTDYQNRLVEVVNSLRHLQQNPTASRLHRWHLATQQANGAAHRLLDQPPLFGRPDIELGRILLPAIRELATEAIELGRFVELERERERRAQERERRTEEQSSPESERDATHPLTAALRRYVQRNRTSMRARASFHTGPILDILRRYLGRDQAALTEFVQQLSVSDPVLSSEISLGGALVRALTERTFINDAMTALRSYVEEHRSELDTNPENHVTPIREILVSHLGPSSTVARQFLDGLRSTDPELHAYVSLGGRTLAEFIARDQPILPSVGRALIHGLMGEWHPETDTTGMSEAEREEAEAEDMASIGVSTGVSLIPVLDQVSDARDLTAHAYFMISRDGEIRSPLRWVGLVFSLIGAIPTVGSAIKGLSQVLMRGVSRHGYRAVARAYNLIERVLPGTFDVLIELRRGLISGWETITRQAQEIWTAFLGRGRGVLERLIGLTTERLRQIEALASRMMPEAFARARVLFEESFDAITSAVRRAGAGIAEGVPRFLANVRERFMSLNATGRMQLELERFEALERAAREAFERGDIPTAERLVRQLDELVSGAGRQADELTGASRAHIAPSVSGEIPHPSSIESTPIGSRTHSESSQATSHRAASASDVPTEAVLEAEREALRSVVRDPESIRPVSNPRLFDEGYEVEIQIGEHTYRRHINGRWCRSSDFCAITTVPPIVDEIAQLALARDQGRALIYELRARLDSAIELAPSDAVYRGELQELQEHLQRAEREFRSRRRTGASISRESVDKVQLRFEQTMNRIADRIEDSSVSEALVGFSRGGAGDFLDVIEEASHGTGAGRAIDPGGPSYASHEDIPLEERNLFAHLEGNRARRALRRAAGRQLPMWQVHHLIPLELRRHSAVYEYERLITNIENPEAIAAIRERWINQAGNSLPMPSNTDTPGALGRTIHRGSHPEYTGWVETRLDDLWNDYRGREGISLEEFQQRFEDLVKRAKWLLQGRWGRQMRPPRQP